MSQGMGPGQQPPGGQPAAARPGQMTAVMRAVAQQSGPKVLRIGVVQGGRVIEERVIKQRGTVTVGQSEKSVFVIPSTAVPAQFKLFELIGNDYHLNFLDGMGGRVALATGISDLAGLRGQAKRVQVAGANAYQVRLTEEARGKVIIGDTTFLFQFVAPPPPQPRPQLPLAVKGGLASQIDSMADHIGAGIDRTQLQELMPPGGARNAIDCALWDLEAKNDRTNDLGSDSGLTEAPGDRFHHRTRAHTAGDGAKAAAATGHQLLKIKLNDDRPPERLQAIRAARPDVRIVVDANQAWTFPTLRALAPQFAALGVDLIEQPLRRGEDAELEGYRAPVPLCADESCLHLGELAQAAGRY